MGFWLNLVLVLAVSAVTVIGRPEGAPEQACTNGLIPAHTSPPNGANQSYVPFSINTGYVASPYRPGGTYYILLENATSEIYFRGFIVQARTMADPDGGGVGQFMTDSSDDQQQRCSGTAVTHTDPEDKVLVNLTWVAPPAGTGSIFFRYAFVEAYSPGDTNYFWANLDTDPIEEQSASAGLVAGTMLIAMLSTITMLIN